MTFSEWLGALGNVISAFITWLSNAINVLINNYIFLTILGISLFLLLFDLVFKFINFLSSKRHDIDNNVINKKYYNDDSWKHKVISPNSISDDLDRYWWEHKHDGRL